MVIKGRSRGRSSELAAHLARLDTNERMEILEIRDLVADDLPGALAEMEAASAGVRCKRPLYHASINVRADEEMTAEQWTHTVDQLGDRLGLSAQPRVVVMHHKLGRTHVHVVWGRVDTVAGKAIHDGHNFRAHEEVARALEREFGHARVQGAHAERDGVARPPRTAEHWEVQQRDRLRAKQLDRITEEVSAAWKSADSGPEFKAEIEVKGYRLARGDRRDFVLIDGEGAVHSLARRLEGIRATEVRARLVDLDRETLPAALDAAASVKSELAAREVIVDAREALAELTHRNSWFTERDIRELLLEAGVRDIARGQEEFLANQDVLALYDGASEVPAGWTTHQIREQEEAVLARAERMAGRRSHVVAEGAVAQSIAAAKLDTEQAVAARTVLTGGDLVILRGRAGTGKSTTLAAVRTASVAGRYKVIGLAPTNAVAQDLRDSGFTDATTVHSLLWYREHAPDHERAKLSAETVLVVDEAAMLSTDILDRLSAAAEESGAKLVLVGDDRQLASIDRGGLFGPLADRIGAAALTTVRRQEQNWARRASEAFAEGRFDDGLRDYQERGLIEWRENLEGAERTLVDRWRTDTESGSGKRFAFAYTNEAVDRLNKAMQAVEATRGRVRDIRAFDTERGEVRLGVGDPIAFRATDKSAGIYAGSIGSVEAIDGSVLTVKMGRGRKALKVNAEEFREFSLGYAGTIYRGQGKTLDQAYLLHTSHWRDASAYVAMTRSKQETRIFVGRDQAVDVDHLGRQFSRQQSRGATIKFSIVREVAKTLATERGVARSVEMKERESE